MNDYQNRAAAPTNPQAAALEIVDPALRDFAQKLKLLLPNGSKLSDMEALAGAEYANTSGLDPFTGEFYIVPGTGVVLGYRGALKMQSQQGIAPDYRYRPLTDDERDWHDVLNGDKAVICYATEPNEAAQARQRGAEPRVWQGVGIVRKFEMWKSEEWRKTPDGKSYKFRLPESEWRERVDAPKGRSWGWVAQNRALRDTMKHMGLPVPPDAETIIKQAQQAGINVSVPAGATLSDEQAAALVAEQIAAHVRQIAPPSADQVQAQAARNVAAMRGPKTDDPLGIDAPQVDDEDDRDEGGIKRAPNMPEAPVGEAELEHLQDDTQQAAMTIKARICKLAREGSAWKAATCNEQKRDAVNRGFAILIPNADLRHAIRQDLLGHDSSAYTEGEVAALLGWFDIHKTPDGAIPSAQAVAEVKTLAAALGLAQPTLPEADSESEVDV